MSTLKEALAVSSQGESAVSHGLVTLSVHPSGCSIFSERHAASNRLPDL